MERFYLEVLQVPQHEGGVGPRGPVQGAEGPPPRGAHAHLDDAL